MSVFQESNLIVGPGAIGLFLGCRLERAGQTVTLMDHREKRAHKIRTKGIQLKDFSGSVSKSKFETLTQVTSAEKKFSSAIICVKSYSMENALLAALPWLLPNAAVLVLSNGLGHQKKLARLWPEQQIYSGTITYGIQKTETCQIEEMGVGKICLPNSSQKAIEHWRKIFETSGLVVDQDFAEIAIWKKVIVNCAINPVAAALALRNGQLLSSPALRISHRIAKETARVALLELLSNPHDSSIDSEAWHTHNWCAEVDQICKKTSQNRCSMLLDLQAGRSTEIGALNEEVVRLAKKHKISVPVTEAFASLVQAMENSNHREHASDGCSTSLVC